MRIIAGEAGGRRLKSIKGTSTRPTLDRIKEAVFNMIVPYLEFDMAALDLFAGFGGVGLEAVSRGIRECTFVEKDKRNIKVLKENIRICKFEKETEVVNDDVFKFLKNTDKQYDLVFMDPPYAKGLAVESVDLLLENDLIKEFGFIIIEEKADSEFKEWKQLQQIKKKTYGDTGISIYQYTGGKQ